jgi:1-acyl-sn-glycerol-3-phosphate acyltransferase
MAELLKNIKAAVRISLFVLCCLLIVIAQSLVLLFSKGDISYALPRLWQYTMCLVFGIKVKVKGTPNTGRQTLFVSNHISYLDIPVIGGILKASFVAKADVRKWPVMGYLCTLQQTAFISRNRSDAAKEKNTLSTMVKEGKNLIIFPEGTSSDGSSVLPFKSSLFGIALEKDSNKHLMVQPITLKILSVDGKIADTQETRDLYAWHGDMTMPPHLWAFAKSKGAEIGVTFHAPYDTKDFKDRKKLAAMCHSDVLEGMETSLAKAA